MVKPNILLILMDDMGWRDVAFAGSTFYETPHLDALRMQGMGFSNAYASCPVCSPSRASLLTGRYPARLGVTDWIDTKSVMHPLRGKLVDAPYVKHLPKREHTLPQALREGGYATWHVGKWHLGEHPYYPDQVGFDVNIAGCWWGHPRDGYFSPYHIETLPDGPEGEHLTDRLTDEALKLIDGRDKEQPFFLNLWYYDVHTPIEAKEEDIEYFRRKAARLKLDQREALVACEDFHTEDKKGMKVTRRIIQSDPVYAAMILNLDRNIGRLLEGMKKQGVLDNTLILFTSDNGGLATAEGSPTCNAPAAEGKGWMYEGGTRVPMLAVWPGHIPPATLNDTPVTTPDIYPTLLEAAGLPFMPEQHCDGVSLIPLFRGDELPERPLFWHYPHYGNQGGTPGASVRLGRYKLIEFFEDDHIELYDLVKDISESNNLSQALPEVVGELRERLHQWQREVEALFPTPGEAQ